MGIEIKRADFDAEDRRRFAQRLETQLAQLRELLSRPDFGRGAPSVGAELELYLVDDRGLPAFVNEEIHASLGDPQLTLELNRYNLEYNLLPHRLDEGGLLATEQEIVARLEALRARAADFDARVVPIGILPTLREEDFGVHCVTDRTRYRALVSQLLRWRGSAFHIDINGPEPLEIGMSDITLEGANTSFQIHQRVDPGDYVDSYNAVQLVTPLVLAISANSPGLFGHDLWDETRIPLFKQSIDTRHSDRYRWSEPARVDFGHGWLRGDPVELFEESVRLFRPLLPACSEAPAETDGVPRLDELRLHQSTVWRWNRPVYDHAEGGHLRIEMRALPAGPTAVDMVAGAALMLGLARGLRDRLPRLLPALPFSLAAYNFYRAAQHGLGARIVWPSERQQGLRDAGLIDVLSELLPTAEDGMALLGISREERDRYLRVIERRVAERRSGAVWQRACARALVDAGLSKPAALAQMLDRYQEHSVANEPVSEWPL